MDCEEIMILWTSNSPVINWFKTENYVKNVDNYFKSLLNKPDQMQNIAFQQNGWIAEETFVTGTITR